MAYAQFAIRSIRVMFIAAAAAQNVSLATYYMCIDIFIMFILFTIATKFDIVDIFIPIFICLTYCSQ